MAEALREVDGYPVWVARSEPQQALLACPYDEIFFGGARGGGKTEGCLGEWLAHQNKYGQYCKGVFFRHTLPQLEQVIDRAKELFTPLNVTYQSQSKTYKFNNGATLKFRYLDGKKDAENYQGHEYTRTYFEELTNWKDSSPVDVLRATLRSPHGIQCKMIATGNPGGVGHTWVKERYIDPNRDGMKPITETFVYNGVTVSMTRVFIPSNIEDNTALTNKAQYIAQLHQVGSPELVRAWLEGDWDIAAGAFFEGVWDSSRHIISPIPIPPHWKRWRAIDWGYAAPYSVGWYCIDEDDCIYRYRELYGYGGKANKGSREEAGAVAQAILNIEEPERKLGIKFMNNPADSSMWNSDGRYHSIADIFMEAGVGWEKSVKGAGSRVNGLQEIIQRLRSDKMKVFSNCKHFIRTVPSIPRDEKNLEDVDTDAEDHCFIGSVALYTVRGRILTLSGWKPYRNLRMTRANAVVVTVKFSDGVKITCTSRHRFLTLSGWVEARHLKGQTLSLSHPRFKSLGGCVTTFADLISQDRSNTMADTSNYDFIKRSGITIMAKRLVTRCTSIIKTKIKQTTSLIISNILPPRRILVGNTHTVDHFQKNAERVQKRGMHQKREKRGIDSIMNKDSEQNSQRRLGILAGNVENSICHQSMEQQGFVVMLVNHLQGASLVLMMLTENVLNVVLRLLPRSIREKNVAVKAVQVSEECERSDVYCITVPKQAHFALANGIIVHNCCDELRYSLSTRIMKSGKKPKEHKEPAPHTFDWLSKKAKTDKRRQYGLRTNIDGHK